MTDLVALWGAITGTVSLMIGIFTYFRDASKIKLEFKSGWQVKNSPQYDPNELYSSLTVSNIGRRPVTIVKAGYIFLKKNGGAILSDSMIYGSKELLEGKNVDFLLKEKDMDGLSEINYFVAYDAVGNTYKKFVSPIYSRFLYWLLHVTHVRRKTDVSPNN